MAQGTEYEMNDSENPVFYVFLRDTVENLASCLSKEDFAEHVKSLKDKRSTITKLHELQKTAFVEEIQQDIDYMWNEYNIEDKHNQIVELSNVPNKKKARPISSDCTSHMRLGKLQVLKEKRDQLKALVQQQKTIRMFLQNTLEKKRNIIMEQQREMAVATAKLNTCNEVFDFD